MNNLKDIQNRFIKAIISNDEEQSLLNDIIPSGTLKDAHEAIDVHRKGYYARLTEALGETFEGTWFALGDELFFKLCELYIQKNKSTKYNLSNYGENFPRYLTEHENLIELPFIEDLARFDWMFKELFHEKQHKAIDPAKLRLLESRPNAKLIFGNALRLFKSYQGVYKIWELRAGDKKEMPNIDNPQYLLLYKRSNDILVKELSHFQFEILSSLKSGESFNFVLEQISQIDPEQIINLFQIIGATGIVAQIK